MSKYPKCPNCNKEAVKYGTRKTKLQQIQVYLCKSCNKRFSQTQQNKTYPMQIILKSISAYNLGYTLKQTQEKIEKLHKIKIPISTINNWVNEYKSICTYSRLRKEAIKLYSPKNIIKKQTLSHIQPYTFKCHNVKLGILTNENPKFAPLKNYIDKINSKDARKQVSGTNSVGFPHHIFTYNKERNQNNQRASQLKFEHLNIEAVSKNNLACKLASLALNLATTNNQRHEAIQNFMLINDSTTIAAELPIYLTNWDAGYYRNEKGFIFPLENYKTPITGHIDILQIRNGLIHILDYKPEAEKINATEQLTIYAMALSRKLNLPLYYFKCAWLDENSYFEFFPLHTVYKKQDKIETTKPIIIDR